MTLPHIHPEKAGKERVYHSMPGNENFATVAELLKLLGDPTRLQLFWILCHTEECIINLASVLRISSPAVSHHIRFLNACELLESRKEGKEVYYKAATTETAKLLHVTIEKIMKTACPLVQSSSCDCHHRHTDETIAQMHAYLLKNLDKRISIDALSRKFLMNPTTLKSKFKAAYGHSIAAHIKHHRMEKAAKLLLETDMPVGAISASVGYASGSKFSAAFSDTYGLLPLEYRKKYSLK